MCGIAGIVSTASTGASESLVSAVKSMTDKLAHRGPDGEGVTDVMPTGSGGHLVLGHRRLSIVDLAGGAQPMSSQDQSLWLTFNGEIYNFPELRAELIALGYEFKTQSDTEVVIVAYRHYGTDCVRHFNGMFAFALWDSAKQCLFIARDPYGKKPFFYRLDSTGFQFASELKALLETASREVPPLNSAALSDCSLLRYVPGEQTLFQTLFKLEPGTLATYQPATGELNKTQYYHHPDSQPRDPSAPINTDPTVITKQFLKLLDGSVAARLNCDVPFGAFLSGGIDSTIVVALMTQQLSRPVKTFSIGFEQKDLSELDSARLVADTYGTDHLEKVIQPEDFINFLPKAIYFRDGPVSEPSDIPILLLSGLASEQVKMVLTGEGSDEVLGGYPKHAYEQYSSYTSFFPRIIKSALRRSVRNYGPAKHEKIKCALNSLLADNDSDRMQRWFGSCDLELRDRLHSAEAASHSSFEETDRFSYQGGSHLRNILAFDQSVWLPNNLLERGDRMTMAMGLEARMPFLDTRIASFVSQLPDHYRVRGKTTKWILRQAARDVIPEKIIQRKKLGFKVPMEIWFRTQLADYLQDLIVSSGACIHEYLSARIIRTLFEEHASSRQNHEKILWSLLNMELWLRQINQPEYEFGNTLPAAEIPRTARP